MPARNHKDILLTKTGQTIAGGHKAWLAFTDEATLSVPTDSIQARISQSGTLIDICKYVKRSPSISI